MDDWQDNVPALRELVRGLDAEILMATSGPRALEIALENRDIAVVLLDVRTPNANGFETAELFRLNHATKTIPIIFVAKDNADAEQVFPIIALTTKARVGEQVEYLEPDASEYGSKPLDHDLLLVISQKLTSEGCLIH